MPSRYPKTHEVTIFTENLAGESVEVKDYVAIMDWTLRHSFITQATADALNLLQRPCDNPEFRLSPMGAQECKTETSVVFSLPCLAPLEVSCVLRPTLVKMFVIAGDAKHPLVFGELFLQGMIDGVYGNNHRPEQYLSRYPLDGELNHAMDAFIREPTYVSQEAQRPLRGPWDPAPLAEHGTMLATPARRISSTYPEYEHTLIVDDFQDEIWDIDEEM